MGLFSIPAVSHGGAMTGPPRLLVVHSAETPLAAGYARAIGAYFARPAASTSAHEMVDPHDVVVMLPDNVVAWHVGPAANSFTKGYEQAGRASFSREEWLVPNGLSQMDLLAGRIAEDVQQYGHPLQWASDDQIRRAANDRSYLGGLCAHTDIRRVLGGTTHTDPGTGYPRDLLLEKVASLTGGAPASIPVVTPVPSGPSLPVHPILRQGSSGPAVAGLQVILGVASDGQYGPITAAAVRSYQATHGLAADAVVGPKTWAMLTVQPPAASPVPPPPGPVMARKTVRQGTMNDPDVRYLQGRLGLITDGDFGPKTAAAVRAFQTAHGLVADGICGPLTWKAIG